MGIAITKVTVSKNPVGTSEKFLIPLSLKELTSEPTMYRLPYTLGKEKGGHFNTSHVSINRNLSTASCDSLRSFQYISCFY